MSEGAGTGGAAPEDATGDEEAGPPGTTPAKTGLLIIGGVVAIALIALIVSRGGDETNPLDDLMSGDDAGDVDLAPSPEATAEPDATDDGFSSGIPPIDCNLMLDSLTALDALESEVIGSRYGGPSFRNGETCTTTVDGWDDYYVALSPGPTGDFMPDAQVLGVSGRFVPGVGDAALWFAGPDAEGGGDVGVLSVARQIPQGGLYFRIELGRPDLDDEEQLAIASGLADHVLKRFPGAAPPPEEPAVLTPAEQPPVDRSTWSYRSHVEAGTERGEWTWTEGVIATLEYLLDDRDSLPGAPDGVTERSVGGFLDWVESGLGAAEGRDRAVIEDLLGRFFPDDDLAYLFEDPATLPGPDDPRPGGTAGDATSDDGEPSDDEGALTFESDETGPFQFARSSVASAQDPVPPDCDGLPTWYDASCVVAFDLAETGGLPSGQYYVYGPHPDDLPALGVTAQFAVDVYAAAHTAATTMHPLGTMPEVRVSISPYKGETQVSQNFEAGICKIVVWAQTPGSSAVETAQWIAFEMASCLARVNFDFSQFADPTSVDWFAPALFYYLSDVAVPEGGLENPFVLHLRAEELQTSVAAREHANTMFFTSMHAAFGPKGVVDLVGNTPRSGGDAATDVYLGGVSGMLDAFHTFARQASDNQLADSAGNTFGGGPFASEQVLLEGPAAYNANLEPMRVARLDLVVTPGMYACVDTMEATGDALWSWRPGTTNDSGPWTQSAPEVLDGQSLMLATSTGSGVLQVTVSDVVDEPDDCDPESEPVEPFDFDLDCPDVCGDTEYIKEWVANAIQELVDAVAAED